MIKTDNTTPAADRIASARQEWIERFNTTLLDKVRKWCDDHKDRVAACYLADTRGSTFKFFAVTRTNRYDFALVEEAAELELAVFDKHWDIEFMVLPGGDNTSVGAFVNTQEAMTIYAHGEPAPNEGVQ